ncbi:MAG: OmpH family outer membrane protein [Armatimonadetes bacterium]|nr:OmpH family outer membrane protein [Armatimonadota bacterium]
MRKKTVLSVILPITGVLVLGIAGFLLYPRLFQPYSPFGSLDMDALAKVPEFKATLDQLEQTRGKLEKEMEEALKKENPQSPRTEALMTTYNQKLLSEQETLLAPLIGRRDACVAAVARERKLDIVLDGRIVVCGVRDITRDVIKKFRSGKEFPPADMTVASAGKVGFVDQGKILELGQVRRVHQEYMQFYKELQVHFEAEARGTSERYQKELMEKYNQALAKKKAESVQPLFSRIDETIQDTAKAVGLSLVLDKPQVLFGGKDITPLVIQKLGE